MKLQLQIAKPDVNQFQFQQLSFALCRGFLAQLQCEVCHTFAAAQTPPPLEKPSLSRTTSARDAPGPALTCAARDRASRLTCFVAAVTLNGVADARLQERQGSR